MPLSSEIEQIYQPVENSLKRVSSVILETLDTPVLKLRETIEHFFSNNGKLLRPTLVFLGGGVARTLKNNLELISERNETAEMFLAAATEIFHAATLIHDDIIDNAPLRRGVSTLHIKSGPQAAVLAGDYFQARAVNTIFRYGNEEISRLFLKTAEEICEGEAQEISEKKNINISEETYFEIVRKKTASLLSCAVQTGALVWGVDKKRLKALEKYGYFLGMAFQIIDDYLDWLGEESDFGKTLGSDLEEGVYTLPVIHALASVRHDKIVRILHSPSYKKRFTKLREILIKDGDMEYAFKKSKEFVELAQEQLEEFPRSEYKISLKNLADYVLARSR